MGYALFTARKMSLQQKVNQYNAKLMQISNQETQLTQQTANLQQMRNRSQNMANGIQQGSSILNGLGQFGSMLSGNPLFALGGSILQGIGQSSAQSMQNMNNASYEIQEAQIQAKQQQLDTEKQRYTTLLNAASSELQQVEKAEEQAIKSATPKYVG